MKNKQKSIMTMVLLIGVLATVIVYMYVYTEFNKKTEKLKDSNAVLQTRVDELYEYYVDMEKHQKAIEQMSKEIDKKLGVFPANVREEDALALALKPLQKQFLVDYKSISMGANELIGSIDAEVVQAAKLEKYQDRIEVYKKIVSYNQTTTYNDLKEIVKIYNDYGDDMNISMVSFKKNEESGLLEGIIECQYYFAAGTGASYKAPTFGVFPVGTPNIFKAVGSTEEVDYSIFGLDEEESPTEEDGTEE